MHRLSAGRESDRNDLQEQEYEVKTRVSDGIHDIVESESSIIKTKIRSENIIISSSITEKTLENVIVTIEWNNTEYTKSYSLDGENWIIESNNVTTIEMTENGIIYYQMYIYFLSNFGHL